MKELTKEEQHIADIIKKLFKSGHIQIEVNIIPQEAVYGSGRWNITKTYATIGNECITLGEGTVDIIEPT